MSTSFQNTSFTIHSKRHYTSPSKITKPKINHPQTTHPRKQWAFQLRTTEKRDKFRKRHFKKWANQRTFVVSSCETRGGAMEQSSEDNYRFCISHKRTDNYFVHFRKTGGHIGIWVAHFSKLHSLSLAPVPDLLQLHEWFVFVYIILWIYCVRVWLLRIFL